jgi:hypothetical protein
MTLRFAAPWCVEQIKMDQPYVLLRLRDSCIPDPHYSPLLR